jgi:hypothetical protein
VVLFVVYLLLIFFLVSRHSFFKDEFISRNQLYFLLAAKVAGIFIFYFLYQHYYGGITRSDAGKFHHDAVVLKHYALSDPMGYLRAMSGLQDDSYGSAEYLKCFRYTQNWSEGKDAGFFFSSNRFIIRLHSLFDFIAGGSYFVHALFSCFLGFTGILLLYRSLRHLFVRRHFVVLVAFCFWPSLYIYTAAPMKEAVAVFLIGVLFFTLRNITDKGLNIQRMFTVGLLLIAALFIKPFILLPVVVFYVLALIVEKRGRKSGAVVYAGAFTVLLVVIISLCGLVTGRSFGETLNRQRKTFLISAQGGIYLSSDTRVIRMALDTNLITRSLVCDSCYTLRKHAAYSFWDDNRPGDSLYCKDNTDTLTVYVLEDIATAGRSNISPAAYGTTTTGHLLASFYYGVMFPLFVNATGALQLLASVENLIIICCLVITLWHIIRTRGSQHMPLFFLLTFLTLTFMIAYTSPNSGAIFRYRGPVALLILAAAAQGLTGPGKKGEGPNSSYISN